MNDDLQTQERVSEVTGIPTGTLANYRYLGKGPRYIKIGKRVLYRRADVDAWLDAHTVTPGAAA